MARWKCKCDCGSEVIVSLGNIRNGTTKSCGCLALESSKNRHLIHGNNRRGRKTKEYRAWAHLKARCNNRSDHKFPIYGGRGITVCERWISSFENFLADMGPCPDGKSIDRIDVNGNYEPSNCRWATAKEQANNRRFNVRITIDGMTRTMSEWEKEKGLSSWLIGSRLKKGWSERDAVTRPMRGGD